MAALAGIGDMPDTITDRAVNVTMRRRRIDESVSAYRTRRDRPPLHELRDRLAAWAMSSLAQLTEAEPSMPVEDRAADTWEPLVALADVAGGTWPERARAACLTMTKEADEADEESSLTTKLLTDVRDIFAERKVSFLPSADLIEGLKSREESPWDEWNLTPRKLAFKLRHFGVRTQRNTAGTARGYRIEDLSDAFRRYLRQEASDPSEPPESRGYSSDASQTSDASIRQTNNKRQAKNPGTTGNLTGLTHSDASAAGTCTVCHQPMRAYEPGQTTHPGCEATDQRKSA